MTVPPVTSFAAVGPFGPDFPTLPADRRRVEILHQAARLFADHGYTNTSMNDIADVNGVRKPTLYHYFKTKEEILYWIHEEFISLLLGSQMKRVRAAEGPEAALRGTIDDVLGLMETHPGHVRAFFEHHRELPEDARVYALRQRALYREQVERWITEGIASGDFRSVDARLCSLAIFGMVNWSYQWYRPHGPSSREEIVNSFMDLILNGLYQPSPTVGAP